MSYICKACGKLAQDRTGVHSSVEYPGGLCQGCYKYFHNGGVVYPIPPKGVVAKDDNGKIICHICGRSYNRLGSHIKESHQMTIKEYKEEFGLCNCARTTEDNYHKMMQDYAEIYGMGDRLIETGKNTRIKVGENQMRKGKAVRLQECIDKRNRHKNKP